MPVISVHDTKYWVTEHALNRFKERWHNMYDEFPRNTIATIIEYLEKAAITKAPPNRKQYKSDCVYWQYNNFLFVVTKSDNTVLTIEHRKCYGN